MLLTSTNQLTNELILENLNNYSYNLLGIALLLLALTFISLTITLVTHFTQKTLKTKKYFILILFFSFTMFYFLFNYLYTQYAIKNNNYYVTIDYITKKDLNIKNRNKSSNSTKAYYAILKEHGKANISHQLYNSINIDDSVYVVIIKGLFNSKYITTPIYPTKDYIYEK